MTFHIKKAALVNGSCGWAKEADCKDNAELKTALEAIASRFKRNPKSARINEPVTSGELIRLDKFRVYDGAKWIGIAWLKRNGICS